jgi:hypothetical protein
MALQCDKGRSNPSAFDCFTEDAVRNLGVADWKGREAVRTNLKAFIDTGFTAWHHVTEYWDAGLLNNLLDRTIEV